MVKARKQGRAGRKASFENSQAEPSAGAADGDGPGRSARLKKKVSRKTNFLARVATSAVATSGGIKKKQPVKKRVSKALGDLSTLEDVLKTMTSDKRKHDPKAAKPDKPGLGGTGSSLSRMKITKNENKRLQTVITHPQYKANPLSAIMSHLEATLPTTDELPRNKNVGKGQGSGNMQKKKKKAKGKNAVDDMES